MSKQHSLRRQDHWEVGFHLIFDSGGGVRLTRGVPDLGRNERDMAVTIKVPFALFSTPTLKATIEIAAPEATIPPIDMTTAAEALRQAIGVDVDLKINSPEPVE